jgi:penicillin-binding protein 1A
MNQGLTPCDKRRDEYIQMEVYDKKKHETTIWRPTNANGRFSGDSVPLKAAFAQSINSIAVRLGQEMGIRNISATAHEMGIKSVLEEEPSLALGASDVNLLELANAYCTIADYGKHVEPVLVTRIVDKDGREVYKAPKTEKQVIPVKSAWLMQKMMMGGLREPGATSMSLNRWVGIRAAWDTDFGGKTGTSNNHSDAWFMCISPNLVCGAWVGGEYRCIHFRTGALGQGSRTALPICGYFLESVMSDPAFKQYHGRFAKPDDKDITDDMYECSSYYEQRHDTLVADSVDFQEDEEILFDEDGNPINSTAEPLDPNRIQVPNEDHKINTPQKTNEETVTFDDI